MFGGHSRSGSSSSSPPPSSSSSSSSSPAFSLSSQNILQQIRQKDAGVASSSQVPCPSLSLLSSLSLILSLCSRVCSFNATLTALSSNFLTMSSLAMWPMVRARAATLLDSQATSELIWQRILKVSEGKRDLNQSGDVSVCRCLFGGRDRHILRPHRRSAGPTRVPSNSAEYCLTAEGEEEGKCVGTQE